ncbi:bifunctional demethylmenaquinone methyltransferase/2-methoxy-6-polyprenyl-1,4-benzoquinol methylase UbiE [Candidatus Pelagibacter sp.]|nr:bifunctional demethylmenaquinone methyltransferase/2-methoxy-6-polyprenyl-1,4-benzoquinol methylase UbiE [Candidatus Pelagibacter sp.]MDA9663364.1 bifunctional demethylmenaquinone methyltransferase/2-methoxy-6-polyprenyl-1,4-benzoquinol methylase UbiE [Candidatus Pelagibacter sp.]
MQQYLQNKKGLVQNVFNQVYDKYDLMNDCMSLGIHRMWKRNLIRWMNPLVGQKLIDVACGTGDLGKLYLDSTKKDDHIVCVDPNEGMIDKGRAKLKNYKNIKWIKASAEKLPIKSNTFDYYSISFGLRNTRNIHKALSEAYRVLKPGGHYFCLEFSKIQNANLDLIYKIYSKLIPLMGKAIIGEKKPYEYLIKSIENFINQDELIDVMIKNKFKNCSYTNLSGGIVAIHSGWKI